MNCESGHTKWFPGICAQAFFANKAWGTPELQMLLHETAALIKPSTFDANGQAVTAQVTSRTFRTIPIFAANGILGSARCA